MIDVLRVSLISNIGGLLGLCLGISMISLTEILWFCLVPLLRFAARWISILSSILIFLARSIHKQPWPYNQIVFCDNSMMLCRKAIQHWRERNTNSPFQITFNLLKERFMHRAHLVTTRSNWARKVHDLGMGDREGRHWGSISGRGCVAKLFRLTMIIMMIIKRNSLLANFFLLFLM